MNYNSYYLNNLARICLFLQGNDQVKGIPIKVFPFEVLTSGGSMCRRGGILTKNTLLGRNDVHKEQESTRSSQKKFQMAQIHNLIYPIYNLKYQYYYNT